MDLFKKAEEVLGQDGAANILKQAEGFLGMGGQQQQQQQQSGGESKTTDHTSSGGNKTDHGQSAGSGQPVNYSDITSSAQILFQGIQDKVAGKSDVSDAKLAEAAEHLVKAAKGFDKDHQYTQYFEKAEEYLANYKNKNTNSGGSSSTPKE